MRNNCDRNCLRKLFSFFTGFSWSKQHTVRRGRFVWLEPLLYSWPFTLQFGTENGNQDLSFSTTFYTISGQKRTFSLLLAAHVHSKLYPQIAHHDTDDAAFSFLDGVEGLKKQRKANRMTFSSK